MTSLSMDCVLQYIRLSNNLSGDMFSGGKGFSLYTVYHIGETRSIVLFKFLQQ